eukprot:TRINITY_DN115_c0_g1_i1.p1 TRINITY_DN115_c0_g1~~TRINITY_DN115_c0_g1_i1.p1  ORF type:complete len:598 (-),score=126.27 TRINITY_DN115_c0_g1_i1:1442-3235(-)
MSAHLAPNALMNPVGGTNCSTSGPFAFACFDFVADYTGTVYNTPNAWVIPLTLVFMFFFHQLINFLKLNAGNLVNVAMIGRFTQEVAILGLTSMCFHQAKIYGFWDVESLLFFDFLHQQLLFFLAFYVLFVLYLVALRVSLIRKFSSYEQTAADGVFLEKGALCPWTSIASFNLYKDSRGYLLETHKLPKTFPFVKYISQCLNRLMLQLITVEHMFGMILFSFLIFSLIFYGVLPTQSHDSPNKNLYIFVGSTSLNWILIFTTLIFHWKMTRIINKLKGKHDEYQAENNHEALAEVYQKMPSSEQVGVMSVEVNKQDKLYSPRKSDKSLGNALLEKKSVEPRASERKAEAGRMQSPQQEVGKNLPPKPSGSPFPQPADAKVDIPQSNFDDEKIIQLKPMLLAQDIRQSKLSTSIVNAPAARGKPLPHLPDLHALSLADIPKGPEEQQRQQVQAPSVENIPLAASPPSPSRSLLNVPAQGASVRPSKMREPERPFQAMSLFSKDDYQNQFPLSRASSMGYLIRFTFFYQALYVNLVAFVFFEVPLLVAAQYAILAAIPLLFGVFYMLTSGVVQTMCLLSFTGTLAETDLVEFFMHQKD